MEGTKLASETLDLWQFRVRGGREACCKGRSICASSCGPCSIEDPAVSSSVAGREFQSPKSKGLPAMLVIWQLVDPKGDLNRDARWEIGQYSDTMKVRAATQDNLLTLRDKLT